MESTHRFLTCLCPVITLLTGCYTSTFVYPPSNIREESGSIEYMTAKGGTKYVFDEKPDIVQDSVVGTVNGRQVKIPVSDVVTVRMRKLNWAATTATVVGIGTVTALIVGIAAIESIHVWK
jgi:hypothetical protein